ncbi:MAG: hypothetical protein OSA40_09235 [Phycisphaerales bacterium]|nr:hypothetical protein [Phycisphaerales bacterium]
MLENPWCIAIVTMKITTQIAAPIMAAWLSRFSADKMRADIACA